MKTNKDEKGIALLFTLGMLALLLIMALAFTATSMVEMKNSENNANRAVARLLAKSTVNKVAGLLQFYENVFFSHTESGDPNYAHYDWIHKLDCEDIFEWNNAYQSAINWEYLKANDGSGTEKIFARYAYVVIPGGGVDPGDLVKSGVNESTLVVEERPGVEVNEINIGALYEALHDRVNVVNKFNHFGTGTGVYTGSWLSYSNLFSQVGLSNYASHRKFKTMLQRFCLIDVPQTQEAFWLDETATGNLGDIDIDTANHAVNELYHRFNLARTGATAAPNWNTINIDNLLGISPAFPSASDEYNSTHANYDAYCIPWIKNWSENSGGWPNAGTKAKQIAANLIDYCDSDSIPKTDGVATTYTPATYCGVDKTPYINEVRLRFGTTTQPNITKTGPVAGNYTYSWGAIPLTFQIEVVNCYDTDYTTSLGPVYISYSISGGINTGTAAPYALTTASGTWNNFAIGSPFNWNINNTANLRSYKRTNNLTVLSTCFSAGNYNSPHDIVNRNFTVSNIHLKIWLCNASGNLIDYVEIDNGAKPPQSITNPTAFFYVRYETDDPRHNQFVGEWQVASSSNSSGFWDTSGMNTICNPNPGGDKDIESTANISASPWLADNTVSTWYIRNAPMQSPWELGAIHRAAKWETLNLKKYNSTAGSLITGGGGTYANGDANILDQIKMTHTNTSPKKVPVKTQAKELIQALFRGITVGNNYSAPGTVTSTRQITQTQASNLATVFITKNSTLRSRAELANIPELSSQSFQNYGSAPVTLNTDAKREEIIGKIVNLTENVKNDYFTVIAIAQSIKDVGGNVTVNLDLNYDGTISSSISESSRDINGDNNTTSTGISEIISGCQFGIYNQFADQILSTQKVVAQIYRDPSTKRCTILKFEYYD